MRSPSNRNTSNSTLYRVVGAIVVCVLIFLAVSWSRSSMNRAVEQKSDDIEV